MTSMPDRASRAVPTIETTTTKLADLFDNRPDRDWLNPISMSNLKRAVEAKKTTVHLNGRPYIIQYGHFWESKLTDEKIESVYLKRADGVMAPSGYVRMERILNFDFEKGE